VERCPFMEVFRVVEWLAPKSMKRNSELLPEKRSS
jgi:hypothetical protein